MTSTTLRLESQGSRTVGAEPVTPAQAHMLAMDLLNRAANAPAQVLRSLGAELMSLPADIVVTRQVHQALENGGDTEGLEALSTHPGLVLAEALRIFPGPIATDPLTMEGSGQPLETLAPLCRIILSLGPAASALASVRAERSPRPQTRAVSVRLAHRTGGPVMALVLLNRLLDPEPAVAALAGHALTLWTNHRSHAANAHTAATLVAEALMRPDPAARDAAMRGALHFRHPALVPALIALMTDPVEGRVRRAHTVLRQLTRANLPCEVFAWNQWWNAHQQEHPVEWLLQAMETGEPAVRQAAHLELLQLTGPLAAYKAADPLTSRRSCVSHWRAQWRRAARAA
jgi:hypothetical protein